MVARISSSVKAAVNKTLSNSISAREARELIKNIGGKNGQIGTANELKQLKAVKSQYAKALSPAAKRVIDAEIAEATKRVPKEPKGWSPSSSRGGSIGGGS